MALITEDVQASETHHHCTFPEADQVEALDPRLGCRRCRGRRVGVPGVHGAQRRRQHRSGAFLER